MASLNAEVFTYDFPKVGVNIALSAFPSLSDLGRLRMNFASEISYQFFRDFVWKVKMFDDFDSSSPAEGVEKNDFGISTSIGWLY